MSIVEMLSTGVVLTTPVFFLVTLVVLWKIIRAMNDHLQFLIHIDNLVRELTRKRE